MPNPVEFVRVRIKESGVEKSVPRVKWETNKDAFAKVQGDAVNTNGDPLPPTFPASTGGGSKSGQKAATEKE